MAADKHIHETGTTTSHDTNIAKQQLIFCFHHQQCAQLHNMQPHNKKTNRLNPYSKHPKNETDVWHWHFTDATMALCQPIGMKLSHLFTRILADLLYQCSLWFNTDMLIQIARNRSFPSNCFKWVSCHCKIWDIESWQNPCFLECS